MTEFRAGARKMQDEHRASCSARKVRNFSLSKEMAGQGNMVTNLKELPMAKLEQFVQ